MPVYQIECPDCSRRFTGMVFAGTRLPEYWVCSGCGCRRAQIQQDCLPVPHPLENAHGAGCPCCGSGENR